LNGINSNVPLNKGYRGEKENKQIIEKERGIIKSAAKFNRKRLRYETEEQK